MGCQWAVNCLLGTEKTVVFWKDIFPSSCRVPYYLGYGNYQRIQPFRPPFWQIPKFSEMHFYEATFITWLSNENNLVCSCTGLPHPWKNPWNHWISCWSLKSLNFIENFVGSLKSPWILKVILEILEFCAQCNTSPANSLNCCRYLAFWHELHTVWTSLKIAKKSLEYPWISSMEFRGNPVQSLDRDGSYRLFTCPE